MKKMRIVDTIKSLIRLLAFFKSAALKACGNEHQRLIFLHTNASFAAAANRTPREQCCGARAFARAFARARALDDDRKHSSARYLFHFERALVITATVHARAGAEHAVCTGGIRRSAFDRSIALQRKYVRRSTGNDNNR